MDLQIYHKDWSLIACVTNANEVQLHVQSTRSSCHTFAFRIHGRYWQTLKDAPILSLSVYLHARSRKFYCDNPDYDQHILTERQNHRHSPYARRTNRLQACGYKHYRPPIFHWQGLLKNFVLIDFSVPPPSVCPDMDDIFSDPFLVGYFRYADSLTGSPAELSVLQRVTPIFGVLIEFFASRLSTHEGTSFHSRHGQIFGNSPRYVHGFTPASASTFP